MKNLLLLLLVLSLTSCAENLNHINCDLFSETDDDAIAAEVDPFLATLKPDVTTNDRTGHQANLDEFIQELNDNCEDLAFELVCYACIMTFPAQSEVEITWADGTTKVFDISTPEDDVMTFIRMH